MAHAHATPSQIYADLVKDVVELEALESFARGKSAVSAKTSQAKRRCKRSVGAGAAQEVDIAERVVQVVDACRQERKRAATDDAIDASPKRLAAMARFTDRFALRSYEPYLYYVPRLVNVVRSPCCNARCLRAYRVRLTLRVAGDLGRSGAHAAIGPGAALRPLPHRDAMQWRLLCKQTLCGARATTPHRTAPHRTAPCAVASMRKARAGRRCSWRTRSRVVACSSSVGSRRFERSAHELRARTCALAPSSSQTRDDWLGRAPMVPWRHGLRSLARSDSLPRKRASTFRFAIST